MHWSVRWLLLSFAFSCLMRVSAQAPFSCSNKEEQKSFDNCNVGKWTGTYDSRQLVASMNALNKETRCCMQIKGLCSFTQFAREKCERKPEFEKWISDTYDGGRNACNKSDVKEMCAKEEGNLQPLREDCKQYEKWLKCSDPEKVLSGGIVLTTNWINWLIVMMTVIVVKYCI